MSQTLQMDLAELALALPFFLSGSARELLLLVSPCPGWGPLTLFRVRICLLPQLALQSHPELSPSPSVSETLCLCSAVAMFFLACLLFAAQQQQRGSFPTLQR